MFSFDKHLWKNLWAWRMQAWHWSVAVIACLIHVLEKGNMFMSSSYIYPERLTVSTGTFPRGKYVMGIELATFRLLAQFPNRSTIWLHLPSPCGEQFLNMVEEGREWWQVQAVNWQSNYKGLHTYRCFWFSNQKTWWFSPICSCFMVIGVNGSRYTETFMF